MMQAQWTAVDQYITDLLLPHDPALGEALRASAAAGLPPISVSPPQGKLLHMLAVSQGARRILEIGTLGGYSTIWLARALLAPCGNSITAPRPRENLPSPRLVTLELDPKHAAIARANIAGAGLAHLVELRQGRALDLLPRLAAEGLPPFDFIFIDADKPSTPAYFDWALKLSRPGSLIVIDNVVRDGTVIDAASTDASVQGIRRLNQRLASEPRVSATAIQTVGAKGYDGFALVMVLGAG
jgi:predicted O-methyltransferase YrrM